MRRGKSRTNLKYSGPCYYVGHSGTAHTASLYTLANKSYCVEGCVILLPSFPRLLFHPRNWRRGIHATLATITLLARMLLPFPLVRLALEPNECLMKEEGIKDKVPHHFFFCPTTTSPGPVHESHYARLWLKFPLTCAG